MEQVYAHTRGFNGSVNIPESCDFRSQFDPLNTFDLIAKLLIEILGFNVAEVSFCAKNDPIVLLKPNVDCLTYR